MNKSAVEWLAKELYDKMQMKGDGKLFDEILNQAKEMEAAEKKDIVIKAFNAGNQDNFYDNTGKAAEKYYQENYGS